MENQNLSHRNKKEEKQKIEELKKSKREMEEKLDEMQGRTIKGKSTCVVVFLLTVALLLFFIVGMVKLDVGGISSEMLAPVIGDVPVLRNVLPTELQRKNSAELQAEAALQDYVDTYSAMKPTDAAKVFDSMMPQQEDLVVKILEKLKPDQRAVILSKMSVANAAALTT